MNEAILSASSEPLPVNDASRSVVPSAFRSVLTVVSFVSIFASCWSVCSRPMRASDATWSSWSSTMLVCLTTLSWLVTVPASVPAVPASEPSAEFSRGSAPELMALRAVPALLSEFCVPMLKSVDSLDTLPAVACVFSLRVLRSASVPAAVLLVFSSLLMICWYCALSLADLSFSSSFALLSVMFCMPVTACCADPLAADTADEIWLMLAVDCAVAWETSPDPVSSALLALDESVLSWVCAVPMAVDAPASPLPALAAASCTSFRALRAAFVCCGTLANWVSRSAIAERIVPTFRLVLSSSPMVSLAMALVLPLMVPLAELTALTSTSLTVETKVLLTVRSTTVAPWSVIFGEIGLAFSFT